MAQLGLDVAQTRTTNLDRQPSMKTRASNVAVPFILAIEYMLWSNIGAVQE